LTTAPYQKLEQDLEVFADLGGYKDLGFDLLVQRDFDQSRIDLEIVKNFLNVQGKLHFFPPLTVALIPQAYGIHTDTLEASIEFNSPTKDEHGYVLFNVGDDYITEEITWEDDSIEGVRSEFSNTSDGYPSLKYKKGKLKWDKAIFNAVIIDGQHRFLSLQKYIEKKGIDPSICNLPINFITLIPKPNQKIEYTTLVETARELFIDINKNAKSVSESRQILLDDRDLKCF